MAFAPPQQQHILAGFFRAATTATTHGIVAQTAQTRQHFWSKWQQFLSQFGHHNPHLPQLTPQQRLDLVQAYAHWVRHGHAGRKNRVGAKRVQQALAAVSATHQLALQPSPAYQDQARQSYWPALKQQLESYRRDDPPPQRKLAVPISVPHFIVTQGLHSTLPSYQALADLINIAFYFLLRIGEYAYTPQKDRRRTQRFRVKDVILRRSNQTIIPNNAPLPVLLTATHATLRITNQKNGWRGQCIHHYCTGLPTSPIKALARRVHHILTYTSDPNTCLSTYFTAQHCPHQIRPNHVNTELKRAVCALGLPAFGITPDLVSSHSLRSGGAMAMHLNGTPTLTIKKQGRWSSNTFMQYIHEQIGAFTIGVAAKMSRYIPYFNMDARHIHPSIINPPSALEDIPS